MKLSENFTLEELTATRSKFDSDPSQNELEALKLLVLKVLQPLRDLYGKPIKVNSGFRSIDVNKAVGGVNNSQHLKGEAADITAGADNKLLFNLIRNNLTFDQLIWEKGNALNPQWIHVSFKKYGNRKQILYIK